MVTEEVGMTARMLLLVWARAEAALGGYKYGTRAADYTALALLGVEVLLAATLFLRSE